MPNTSASPVPLPDELTRVPGLLGATTDWIENVVPCPNRPLAFAAALSAFSLVISGKVRFGDVNPETCVIAVGPSGSGKTVALQRALSLLRRAGFGDSIHSGLESPEAIRDLRRLGKPIFWHEEHFDRWAFHNKRFDAVIDAAFGDIGHPIVFYGQCAPEGFEKACRASGRFLDFAMGSMIITAAPHAAVQINSGADANVPVALVDALVRL